MHQLHFFNPYAEIHQTENRLPHWQQAGAVYFVTFRLADAVPSHLLSRWQNQRENWLRANPQPWTPKLELEYHTRFTGSIERWLDAGHGACLLRSRDNVEVVAKALHHFEGVRVVMISFVVMPNHVHTLFVPSPEWALDKLLRSWKGFTTRQINKMHSRAGRLWQRDYFDRLVRDAKHFANCVRYIRRNPEKARLSGGEFILWESDLAKCIA
jgi:putative transposase